MRTRNWVVLLWCMAISAAAPAFAEGTPTTNDLKAAYCLGYANAQQTANTKLCSQIENPTKDQSELCKTGIAAVGNQITRLQKYLLAKGLINANESEAALSAKIPQVYQGETDLKSCRATVFNDKFQACSQACQTTAKGNKQQIIDCLTRECESDVCKKTEQCSTLTFLPE